MDSQNEPENIKLVVIGDGSVGKTCLLLSYTTDKFPTEYVPTIFDNYSAQLKFDNKLINLGLWDTAGQEEYNRLRPLSYPQSDVIFIVFSVVEPTSFENAIKKWYPELVENVPKVIKIFIGNKIDLRTSESDIVGKNAPISYIAASRICQDLGHSYYECSARTQEGLKNIFDQAIKQVLKARETPQIRHVGQTISQPNKQSAILQQDQKKKKEKRFNCQLI